MEKIREIFFLFWRDFLKFLPFLDGSWAIQSEILVAPNT